MKDEIKEMIDDLRDKNSYINNETILTFDEVKLLLDYITNLQKGNHNLLQEIEYMQNKNNNLIEKINKAIEYIGNGNIGIPRKTRDKFVAILKGKDKDE